MGVTSPARPAGALARGDVAALSAVLLAALNLRGAIAAVGPVLPTLRADLGLSPAAAGALTTLPVLCFAVLAPVAAWLGRRVGTSPALPSGLVTVAAGTVPDNAAPGLPEDGGCARVEGVVGELGRAPSQPAAPIASTRSIDPVSSLIVMAAPYLVSDKPRREHQAGPYH